MEIAATTWSAPPVAKPLSEEGANVATHGVGLALSIAGMYQLLATAGAASTVVQVAGAAIFGGSMVLVYLASTLYHMVRSPRLKRTFRVVDHSMIYLLIAGTYTPFLMTLPAPWPTWVLAAIWTLAALGVLFKALFGAGHRRLSVCMYLAIGWFGIFAVSPLVDQHSVGIVAYLLAGGLAYTGGTVFFVRDTRRYSHAVWHLFVMLGSALHYGAVLQYVIPLTFAGSM